MTANNIENLIGGKGAIVKSTEVLLALMLTEIDERYH